MSLARRPRLKTARTPVLVSTPSAPPTMPCPETLDRCSGSIATAEDYQEGPGHNSGKASADDRAPARTLPRSEPQRGLPYVAGMLTASGAPCYRARWVATSAGKLVSAKVPGVFLEALDHLGRKRGPGLGDRGEEVLSDGASLNLIEVLSLKRTLSRLARGELDVGGREQIARFDQPNQVDRLVGDLVHVASPDRLPGLAIGGPTGST